MSLRDQILSASDIAEESVDVPEWGVKLQVRGLTGMERATFIRDCAGKDGRIDPIRGYPELVIMTARDPETGDAVFTNADRDVLMTKAGSALDRVADVALRLAGLTNEAAATAEKN